MTIILLLLLAPFILLTFCFAVEVLIGLVPLRSAMTPGLATPPSAAIIVPAHNEAAILRERLLNLVGAADGHASIVVVADNCTDSSFDIARDIGVEVISRTDPERRGKGFALDFARRHLEAAPPDVVLIIDADCSTDSPSVARLIAHSAATGRPCQATNLQVHGHRSSPTVQLSTFAFYIKNVVRHRALQRIAGRAQLLGTGMAFPWPIFARSDLATQNIVEDLKLSQELAEAGDAPMFVEEAMVFSKAETERNTLSQRRRWEGGFLQNAFRQGPAFLLRSIIRADARGAWAAVNLMIPPFALLLLLDIAALLLAWLAMRLADLPIWPVVILGCMIFLACFALAIAWLAGGSKFVSLRSLARAPLYILWKFPLYLGFARSGPPKEWAKTSRGES